MRRINMNIRQMVRYVVEGLDPAAALAGQQLEHRLPKILEDFSADDLEKLYGEDFTVHGNVRTFQPIDTGAGLRIKNITVRPHGMYTRDDVTKPHHRNSRVYVQPTEHQRVLKTAWDASFGQGKLPQSSQGINIGAALTGQETASDDQSVNAVDKMMSLRKPENNPYKEWRDGVLPHVFKHLGMTGTGANNLPHAQWHAHAGCGMCPCSPGFIVHKSDHPLAKGRDIWVETD